jgi:hypothetical protein
MITQDYIENFRKTQPFQILKEGFLTNDIESVLLGVPPFKITNQYDNSIHNTVPSQVLITAHILIKDGLIEAKKITDELEKMNPTLETVCLQLEYILSYLNYSKDHSEISLDYSLMLAKSRNLESEKLEEMPYCFLSLLKRIDSEIS